MSFRFQFKISISKITKIQLIVQLNYHVVGSILPQNVRNGVREVDQVLQVAHDVGRQLEDGAVTRHLLSGGAVGANALDEALEGHSARRLQTVVQRVAAVPHSRIAALRLVKRCHAAQHRKRLVTAHTSRKKMGNFL